jgi:hypothetical protein
MQNELNLLYDKAILLHLITEKSIFYTFKWKIKFNQIF